MRLLEMGHHGNYLVSVRREWLSWLLWIELLASIMSSQVAMGDESGMPATGLLCISNCATCPTICSPPPVSSSLPPPPSPPLPSSSPLTPHFPPSTPPPQSDYFPESPPPPPPPPPHSSSSHSAPPPSYSTLSTSPPPPPPPSYLNRPSAPLMFIDGPQNSSYPYYYFYASKAASLSLPAFFSYFFTSLLCSSLVFPFW